MGESVGDRASMLRTLANFTVTSQKCSDKHAGSSSGTPLENAATLDPFDFIRTIAAARIMMPASIVRALRRAK